MPGQGYTAEKPNVGDDVDEQNAAEPSNRASVALRYPEEEIISANTAGNY